MARVNRNQPAVGIDALLAGPPAEQEALGYRHTLREIVQQPSTWPETAVHVAQELSAGRLVRVLEPHPTAIALTGSGSSLHIGECLAFGLQRSLGLPVHAVAAGTLLTHLHGALPPGPGLLVSFARSGDSPESCGVVDAVLTEVPRYRHLIFTCNAEGRLATRYRDDPRVTTVVLSDRTNDRSLVMTSSFTNLLMAGRSLASIANPHMYAERAARLGWVAARVLEGHSDALATIAGRRLITAAYLGSGPRYGAARESALKMLEMSAGRVRTTAESFLGLRHGPMSALNEDTLVVGFLACDPTVRSYEFDLLRELMRKGLGAAGKVLVGENIPEDLAGANDVVVETPGLEDLGDDEAPLIDVLTGQLLAFFHCVELGFKPDSPSQGVITRVVEEFAIHRRDA